MFSYVIDAYRALTIERNSFTRMLDLLAGNVEIRRAIADGDTTSRYASRGPTYVEDFPVSVTAPYLLYPE